MIRPAHAKPMRRRDAGNPHQSVHRHYLLIDMQR
jgi:hypothetical protein